jgi:hypothetical protein
MYGTFLNYRLEVVYNDGVKSTQRFYKLRNAMPQYRYIKTVKDVKNVRMVIENWMGI